KGFLTFTRWLAISLLVFVLIATPQVTSFGFGTAQNLETGPFIDKLVYRILPTAEQRFLAMEAGEIEMDTGFSYDYLNALGWDLDVNVYETTRNGYMYIDINCREFPLNMSEFRRAFAYAFDKTQVRAESYYIEQQVHDSVLPLRNPWCIEDTLEPHYYYDNSSIGNQILDTLGFAINASTGYRTTPDGMPITIYVEYLESMPVVGNQTAKLAVEVLNDLHIKAASRVYTYWDDYHQHYIPDMLVSEKDFDDFSVEWLVEQFHSDNSNYTISGFSNSTYDSYCTQMLHGTSYDNVFGAISEMQKILHHNAPRLVVFQDLYYQGYRNDIFTGQVEDIGRSMTGPWTMCNVRKIDGTQGGTFVVGIGTAPPDLNFFLTENYTYQEAKRNVLENLHLSLYTHGPDFEPYPQIASSIFIETHEDNSMITDGHTRMTIDIVDNLEWSDEVPLTAEDVVFTFTYGWESRIYGNPEGIEIADLVAAYSPTSTKAVLEFSSESYWYFDKIAYDYILPKHAFTRGPDTWDEWNPFFNASELIVNCGPFAITDFEQDEFYELTVSNNRNIIVDPYAEIRIVPAYDVIQPFSLSGFNLTWNVEWHSGAFIPPELNYTLFLDGAEYQSGTFETAGTADIFVVHVAGGLSLGEHNFTLVMDRFYGGQEVDTVMVTVQITVPQIVSAVSLTTIFAVGFLCYRKRRK
ncbi:MAG: ABC transporter substrate-binding protein, partial [Candidatus Thorarchaeota archaeon]